MTVVKSALRAQRIELPSWAFGNSGTRFKVFGQPGVPRTPQEKIDDASQVHAFTGVAPSVALHIPWDQVDDYAELAAYARDRGVGDRDRQRQRVPGRRLQARQRGQPGSGGAGQGGGGAAGVHRRHGRHRLKRPEAVVRRWHQLPRPGRHPGPPGPAGRGADAVYERLGPDQRMLLEYKLFEPSFYTTDVPDWGTSLRALPGARPAARRWWWTPGTTRRAPTSSSSWRCCCGPGGWARSTSTPASTPTTT